MNKFICLKSIKIHIPSIERLKEIVEYFEYNDTLIKQLEKEIENNKKQAQQFITGIVKSQVQVDKPEDASSITTEPTNDLLEEVPTVKTFNDSRILRTSTELILHSDEFVPILAITLFAAAIPISDIAGH